MQMIDVMKRLAQLDAQNPRVEKKVVKQELNGENAVTGLNKYTGEEVHESISVEELQQLSGLKECGPMGMPGMMGGMEQRAPATFSINASAASGDEVATMLGDILNLAGVKELGDKDISQPGAVSGHDDHLTGEPPMAGGHDDIKAAIDAIDKADGPEMDDEAMMDPAGADGMGGTPDVGAMADEVQDMAQQLSQVDKSDLDIEEENRLFDNSPKESTRAYDPNDFANVVNKIRSFDYTPARGGDNPLQSATAESVEQADPVRSVASQLFAEFKAFKG